MRPAWLGNALNKRCVQSIYNLMAVSHEHRALSTVQKLEVLEEATSHSRDPQGDS